MKPADSDGLRWVFARSAATTSAPPPTDAQNVAPLYPRLNWRSTTKPKEEPQNSENHRCLSKFAASEFLLARTDAPQRGEAQAQSDCVRQEPHSQPQGLRSTPFERFRYKSA